MLCSLRHLGYTPAQVTDHVSVKQTFCMYFQGISLLYVDSFSLSVGHHLRPNGTSVTQAERARALRDTTQKQNKQKQTRSTRQGEERQQVHLGLGGSGGWEGWWDALKWGVKGQRDKPSRACRLRGHHLLKSIFIFFGALGGCSERSVWLLVWA